MAATTPDELWAELEGRWPESQVDPSLTRVASVLELLGEPHRAMPVIHVAGTNGKSSTSRMIEVIARTYGLSTGLFTSPHLVDPRERIMLSGEPVEPDRLLRAWAEIEPYVQWVDTQSQSAGGPRLSYFEVLTVLAFAIFADTPVDVAIVEVGMGGTWDATNLVQPAVSVVTPIGLDHQNYLGDTIEEIATEKAGIIKGAAAVISQQSPGAGSVLLERCASVDVVPALEGRDFAVVERSVAVGGQQIGVRGIYAHYGELFLPLFGQHQAHNAALAIAAMESFLGAALDDDLLVQALAEVTSPGRLHVVRRGPTVIVDAAHNPHGAAALAEALRESFDFTALIGVVGVLADKDVVGFVEVLAPSLDALVATEPPSPRAASAEVVASAAENVRGDLPVSIQSSVLLALDEALALAERAGPSAGIVVTGSVVLVGEVLRLLGKDEA